MSVINKPIAGPVQEEDKPAAVSVPAGRFDTVTVATMSFGHFVHDTYPAFLAPLLPLLVAKLDITLAAAGVLAGVIRWSALIQPFLGHLADRSDPRYWIILAPTVTALCMSLLGVAPSYAAVVALLAAASLSHSAFHPAAAAGATLASGRAWGKGTALFMTGGELGRAVGPLFIGAIVLSLGLEWSWIAVFPAILASLLMYWRLGRAPRLKLRPAPSGLLAALRRVRGPLALLAGVILFRNLASQTYVLFYPTYLIGEGGGTLLFATLALTAYELAGAVGALLGGTFSDRLGRRTVLVASQVLAIPSLLSILFLPEGAAHLAVMAFAGLVALATGPVQMVLIQELLPDNRSAATGLLMMVGLEGTILTSIAVGAAADVFGLRSTLLTSVALSTLSIPFILLLPETRAAVHGGHG